MAYSDSDILAAVRALLRTRRSELNPALAEELRRLLAAARAGAPVANQIVELLAQDAGAREWALQFLDFQRSVQRSSGSGQAPNAQLREEEQENEDEGVEEEAYPRAWRPSGVTDRSSRNLREPLVLGLPGSPQIALDDLEQREHDGPRRLLTRTYDLAGARPRRLTRAFRAAAEHEVAVMIGPIRRGWTAARGTSIDELLPRGAYELTLVFFVPDRNLTQTAQVVLPPRGPTQERRFRFTTGAAGSHVKVLISVVYQGRTVQAAELTGEAVEDPLHQPRGNNIDFRIAVPTPPLSDLDIRQPFDGTLQITRAPDGRMVGVATTEPPQHITFSDFGDAPQGIRDLLGELAEADQFGRQLDSGPSVDFLRRLALLGAELDEVIGNELRRVLDAREIQRIQVLQSDPDVFVPVEFIYDLDPPADPARLCKNWRRALEDGTCDARTFHRQTALGDLEVVCPSGFWFVSKVIERQSVLQTKLAGLQRNDPALWSEPGRNRQRLAALHSAVFAWSARVDNAVPGQSGTVLKTLAELTDGNALAATTWLDWVKAVQTKRPALLVLLTHTTDEIPARLQIGPDSSTERRALIQINSRFVKAAGTDTPLVLLLGCDTATVDHQLYSFAARFRAVGASVVLGTLSAVLGEHVAPVANGLVQALAAVTAGKAANGAESTFGEVWRQTRRRLLAQGELTALCVTAYGDAGWLI